jgi:serine/threonine protein kinase
MMDEQGKFEFIKELGRGSFGSVVLARNTKTGEQVRLLQADSDNMFMLFALGLWSS